MHIECSAASHDGELERKPGEAGVPWSRKRAERVSDALVEKLSMDQEQAAFSIDSGSLTVSSTATKQVTEMAFGSWSVKGITADSQYLEFQRR